MKSLRDLGWRDGTRAARRHIVSPGGDPGRLDAQAAELAALAPDAILTVGTPATVRPAAGNRRGPDRVHQCRRPVSTGLVREPGAPAAT